MRGVVDGKSCLFSLVSGALFFLGPQALWGQTVGTGTSTGSSGSRGGTTAGTGGSGGSSGFSGGTSGFQSGTMGTGSGTMGQTTSPFTGASLTPPTTGTTGSATGIPSNANLFRSYYASPWALGLSSSGSTKKTFGQPLYSLSTATTGVTTGSATMATGNGAGFTTIGVSRAPAYVTTLGDGLEVKLAVPAKLQTDLQGILERSTSLPSRPKVQVLVKENLVVLQGTVSSAKERRLAEGLVRLTPGVQEVLNQLTVAGPAGEK